MFSVPSTQIGGRRQRVGLHRVQRLLHFGRSREPGAKRFRRIVRGIRRPIPIERPERVRVRQPCGRDRRQVLLHLVVAGGEIAVGVLRRWPEDLGGDRALQRPAAVSARHPPHSSKPVDWLLESAWSRGPAPCHCPRPRHQARRPAHSRPSRVPAWQRVSSSSSRLSLSLQLELKPEMIRQRRPSAP